MQDDPAATLRERLRRYTPERHPLQHAVAQFHLGGVLLAREAVDEAELAFTTAAALFRARGARPEEAKALNGLGATLRAAGRLDVAARALRHAAAQFAAADLPLDEGAASFNLGLVLHEQGRPDAAEPVLVRAVRLLDPAVAPAQAAAALRELGAARLDGGRPEAAEDALAAALELAERAGDEPGRAAAANALGLARLARERAYAAAQAFAIAVAASPRSIRPELFAMASANLALACERAGAPARARLAAAQALGAPRAPAPVLAQAGGVLERLGTDPGDLGAVLAEEDVEGRERLARAELRRGADADEAGRAADARAWLAAHLASELEPVDVAELWLGGLLELPPQALDSHVRSVMRALSALPRHEREVFRDAVTRAMARFHVPQWTRLQEVFSRAAADAGDPGSWR